MSVKIRGAMIIEGIAGRRKCKVCGTNEILIKKYDSFFCPKCNKWSSGQCRNPKCYCMKRPKNLLPKNFIFEPLKATS